MRWARRRREGRWGRVGGWEVRRRWRRERPLPPQTQILLLMVLSPRLKTHHRNLHAPSLRNHNHSRNSACRKIPNNAPSKTPHEHRPAKPKRTLRPNPALRIPIAIETTTAQYPPGSTEPSSAWRSVLRSWCVGNWYIYSHCALRLSCGMGLRRRGMKQLGMEMEGAAGFARAGLEERSGV